MESGIRNAIEAVLRDLGLEHVDFAVEHPPELSRGDYATNVAMVVAQFLKKNPREVAESILKALEGKVREAAKIEIAGPGFINFHLTRDFFKENVVRATSIGDEWGRNDSLRGKRILVEYTDPNPFKEFHVGHIFSNTVGESIARLFMMSGADVKRVNYQGDVGLHVAYALWGMRKLGLGDTNDFTPRDLGKAYALGASTYKEDEKAKAEIIGINKLVYERSDELLNQLYDKGKMISLRYFETIYEIVGTKFDAYFFESVTGPRGKELVLSHPELFKESDGARVFEGEKFGLHTRVFLNSEGLPTYEAKELALAKVKEEELGEYDLSIVSTSREISEYFKVLKKAMSFVYPELEKKTEHIGHGTVRLATGKMSSRTGDVIAALDFIDEITDAAQEKMMETTESPSRELAREIAIGAIKYAMLRSNIFQDSVFNKEQALSFEGDSGPYLMYTHARIASIEAKASDAGIIASTSQAPEVPYVIERILYQFPEVLQKAQEDRAPHTVVIYLTELAGAFNTFYAHEKIVDTQDVFAPYKLALAQAVKVTLKNGLYALGIKAPEKM